MHAPQRGPRHGESPSPGGLQARLQRARPERELTARAPAGPAARAPRLGPRLRPAGARGEGAWPGPSAWWRPALLPLSTAAARIQPHSFHGQRAEGQQEEGGIDSDAKLGDLSALRRRCRRAPAMHIWGQWPPPAPSPSPARRQDSASSRWALGAAPAVLTSQGQALGKEAGRHVRRWPLGTGPGTCTARWARAGGLGGTGKGQAETWLTLTAAERPVPRLFPPMPALSLGFTSLCESPVKSPGETSCV